MATNYLTLTGNYSLNPFKKKDPNALTTPTTNSNTNTVKLSASDLQKANNPYGFSTTSPQGQAADLSPDSLFKTSTQTTTPYKTVADTTPKIDTTKTTTPSALDNYLANLSKLSNTQIGNEKQNYQDTVNFETGQANDQNKALLDSLNSMKTSMDNYTTSTNKNRDTSKATAESQYGLQQLQTAKTRQESEARNRNRFAALNTADSAGAGSYDEAQSNVESQFNKDTQTILQAKQAKLDEIDSAADTSIQTQIDKYNDYVRQVNSNVNTNNATKAKNIAAAKYALNTSINNIQANVENLKYQQLSTGDGQLSENFLKTGVPTTAAEYKFLQANKDAFATKSSSSSAGINEATTLIDEISNSNLKPVTGVSGKIGLAAAIPGTDAYTLNNKITQLKSKLQLASAGLLKGQGQVSDAERRMLAEAVTALNTGMSEKDFKAELAKDKAILLGNTTATTSSVTMLAPDGQTYTVDPSEVQSALANGWRKV